MKCHKMEVLLSCYLDGELSPEQSAQVSQHLSECSSCAQEYRTLRKNQLVLASLSRKEPSAEVWDKIQKRVVTDQAAALLPSRRIWPAVRRVVLLAASIAVLLFFGIVAIGYFSHDEEAPPPQVSQRTFLEGHATFVSDHNPLSDKAAWAYVRSKALQGVDKEHVSP